MGHLAPFLKTRFFDANGAPLVGGKVYSYQAGTSTPLVTYTDESEVTPNANPTILDANGEAQVWIGADSYKFVVKDSNDVTLFTVDDVAHINPLSITTDKIADSAITSAKIADGEVGTTELADASVTTAKLLDASVTAAKLDASAISISVIQDKMLLRKTSNGFWIPQFDWTTPTKLALEPAGAYALAYSPDGNFLAVGGVSTSYVYARRGDDYVKIASLAGMPSLSSPSGFAWSPCGNYLAAGVSASPYMVIYKRQGTVFTKLSDPGTLPTGAGWGAAWSPSGEFLSIAHTTTPFVTIYQRSVDTFTKLSDPGTLPAGNGLMTDWSRDGSFLAVAHTTTPFVTIYQRSGTTFTKLSNPGTLPAGNAVDVKFSPDGTLLAVGHGTSPFLTVYSISGTTFTKIANPASLPPDSGSVFWHPSGNYLATIPGITPFVNVFSLSGTTLTKLADPATLLSGGASAGSFSPSGQHMALIDLFSVYLYKSADTLKTNAILYTKEVLDG